MIPKDPVMLLSYINTQLRDYYPSLEELCASLSIDMQELVDKMKSIDYAYDQQLNKFI